MTWMMITIFHSMHVMSNNNDTKEITIEMMRLRETHKHLHLLGVYL